MKCRECKYSEFIREKNYLCTNYYSFYFCSCVSGDDYVCGAPEYESDIELEAKLKNEKREQESPNQGHFEFEEIKK